MSPKKGVSSLFAPFSLLNWLRFNARGPFPPTAGSPPSAHWGAGDPRLPPLWQAGPAQPWLLPSRTAAAPRVSCTFPSCGLAS